MIKIALTNLRRYNEGELIFEWVDLPCNDFKSVFDRIGHDEHFISDYECEIPHTFIHEYENLTKLNETAQRLEDLNEYETTVLIAIMESEGNKLQEALETLDKENFIFYEETNLEELARQFVEEGMFGDISANLMSYLDYEKIVRDLKYDGYVQTSVGIIVFD